MYLLTMKTKHRTDSFPAWDDFIYQDLFVRGQGYCYQNSF